MKSQAAVLHGVGQDWQIETIELDPPRAGEVLVKMSVAGICHSDDHFATEDSVPDENLVALIEAAGMPLPEWFPLLGGHEGAGIVHEIGPGVTTLQPGDHVAVSFIPSCGDCRWCATGASYLCDVGGRVFSKNMITDDTPRRHLGDQDLMALMQVGTFSEYVVASERSFIKVHDWISLDADNVVLTYPSGRIERDTAGFHWHDASGRFEIHGTGVTDIFTVHVPEQAGIDDQAYYRHELLAATGTIDGVAVSGYLHQDYAYGPGGKVYPELPIARQLQGMWVSWLHEYPDGERGGGSFWQGRDGVPFGPGYQLKAGVTTAHNDIVATPTFNAAGKLTALDTVIGADSYAFTFDTAGSYVHYFGRLTSSSDARHPARSWCWVEYAGAMLSPEILDMVMQQYRLARGR